MDYKILIADDEPEIRNLLRLYLENENYHVIEAEDGQRALDLLRAEQPALCILDIMMPKIDGYTATRVIRSTNRQDAKAIPIIAMTAHVFDEDVKQCLEAGMNAHLPKPLQMEKVVSTIARLCKRKK